MSRHTEGEFAKRAQGGLSREQMTVIQGKERLAEELWEGFRVLGEDFEVWLLLAVNGVMYEKEGDEEATLAEIAHVIETSGALELLGIELESDAMLPGALQILRANPDIVPVERRRYLREISWERNMIYAQGFRPRILDELGDKAQLVRKFLAADKFWHANGSLKMRALVRALQAQGVDVNVDRLIYLLEKPEFSDLNRERTTTRLSWSPKLVDTLTRICHEYGARRSSGDIDHEYVISRFQTETGIKLAEPQLMLRVGMLRKQGLIPPEFHWDARLDAILLQVAGELGAKKGSRTSSEYIVKRFCEEADIELNVNQVRMRLSRLKESRKKS